MHVPKLALCTQASKSLNMRLVPKFDSAQCYTQFIDCEKPLGISLAC